MVAKGAGVSWTKEYIAKLPEAIKANLSVEKSDQRFKFGGGEERSSLGRVTLPVYVLDDEYQAHVMAIKMDVVDADLCMLFGGRSLDKAGASMKFGDKPYLFSDKIFR